MIDIKVPTVGESISEVTLLKWNKKDGEYVERDEVIAELESEKATFEVNAEQAGIIKLGAIKEGDTIKIGDLLASIDDKAAKPERGQEPGAGSHSESTLSDNSENGSQKAMAENQKPPKAEKNSKSASNNKQATSTAPVTAISNDIKASPVASAIIADRKVDPATVTPTGPAGKILKDDVLAALSTPLALGAGKKGFNRAELFSRNVRTEKMSNLRKTISRRLVEAKNTTAMLTTFNEVDMGSIMEIRTKYKDKFKEIHGVGLGFMSFFAKACATALAEWPSVNAYIDGDQLVYHDYADISIAVSTPRGLTVPVMRNVESKSMADIERNVIELAGKARDSKLTAEELTGGTFTITNGGVFGSLMSTPIINIPQSAILGMHKIQERPMVVNGQVVVRPMMYLALSYDHRIIDGRESVSFLVRVKELLENPEQLLIGKDPVKTLLEL
ncbi:MAG TPA: 2-oxoglutarate dehydrogenase complex dihydrolipoyllysine-residue succinyltransferase [Chitinophagaceae bacterium]|nr:2-oxoglutarate dehydrogenase complex dihydrolipoyllysine-residue succinyltransferase [Chitinophagaceae bacterium]